MTEQISQERKSLYTVGLVMQIIGCCLFALPFITIVIFMISAVSSDDLPRGFVAVPIAFGFGFAGFVLIAGGGFVRVLAARGKAGSGLVLDPQQARKDVEPWSRMQGGVLKDTLDEAGVNLGQVARQLGNAGNPAPQTLIMLKCTHCGKLNEEDSKFCQECGDAL